MSKLTYIAGWPLLAALLLVVVPRNYRVIIRAIAVLSAFGWPREDRPAPWAGLLATLRQRYFPDDAALQEAYLAQATDIYDLEYRMAEWESRHGARTAAGLRVRFASVLKSPGPQPLPVSPTT